MAQANIKAVISAEDNASTTLKKFGANASSIGNKIEDGLKKLAVAGLAAGAAVVAFGASSVKAYQEAEEGIAQTNAVLASTKGIAGVTAQAVDDLSKSLQRQTKYSDEDVRSVENLLLTFTSIGKDVFPQATKTVLNMSTALGQDTKSSAVQLGKALQDPIKGITALRRVGVNFTEKQQDVIAKLVETGKSAEAQRLILKELETEFGGSAEAAGNTFSGALEKLKNQFNDVQESIGLTIVNGLTPLADKLAQFLASDQFQAWLEKLNLWMQVHIPLAIDYVTNTVLPALKTAFDTLWPAIQVAGGIITTFLTYMKDNTWIVWALVGAIVAVKTALFIADAVNAFKAGMLVVQAVSTTTSAVINSTVIASLTAIGVAAGGAVVAVGGLNAALAGLNAKNAIDKKNAETRNTLEAIKKSHPELTKQIDAKLRDIGYADGGFTGRGGVNDVAGIVHKGEYVLPQSQVDQSSGLPKMASSSNINVTVNAGVMTGTDSDMRKLTSMVVSAIQDIASAQGKTPVELLGSKYGIPA